MKKFIPYIFITAFIVVFIVLFRQCGKENKVEIRHNMIVMQIEELGRLEVSKYNIQNIVDYKKTRQWLPNAKTVLIAVGEVVGCIDLTALAAEDVELIGDSIHVTLPQPEVCYAKIDHNRSRVYNVEYGWWDTSKLVDEAYRYAEAQLYAEALRLGVMETSRKNAIKAIRQLLTFFGYTKLGIDFKQPDLYNTPVPLHLPSELMKDSL